MSTEIYYFSGTGNSLHVAKELGDRLPESELIPILGLLGKDRVTTNGEIVGLVFPHYASTLPKPVHQFVQKLGLGTAAYLFAIATRGGTRTWSFDEIDKILEKKGRRLDCFAAITMPSGSEPLVRSKANRITGERTQRLEDAMLVQLDAIQTTIVDRVTSREDDSGATPPPAILAPLIPLINAVTPLLIPLGKMVETSFDFYCDDKCNGCGVCAQVCLGGKVQLSGSRPVWPDSAICHGCFACLNYCPEEAVQVKSKWYLKSHTPENGRYHHPEISAGEIAMQKVAVASSDLPLWRA
jgi:NAD-dependent dihydropyrimidine dehydrogenase PreA subunit